MQGWSRRGGADAEEGGRLPSTQRRSSRSWRRSTAAPASLRCVARSRSRARPSTTPWSGSTGAVRANLGPRRRNEMLKSAREQERGKRLSREERDRASCLRQYLGIEVGVRRSAAQIGEQLPAHDRKNGRTGELVSKITSHLVAEGLAEVAPGPRGGAGWSLTQKGKALIDRADGAESFEASRGGRNP